MTSHPNPDMAHWMRELRKSNATSKHEDRRKKRAKSRKQALRKHLRNEDNE